MKTAVITSCCKEKTTYPGPAWLVNRGQLLRLVLDYAKLKCADLFILSAKYGLIPADTIIEPYNQKLKTRDDIDRIKSQVRQKVSLIKSGYEKIIVIMGKLYRGALGDISDEKFEIIEDVRGIGGLYQKVSNMIKEASMERFQARENMIELYKNSDSMYDFMDAVIEKMKQDGEGCRQSDTIKE